MKKLALLLIPIILLLTFLPIVLADTATDKAAFDQILKPVLTIYNFIKYAASVIAMIFLLFAGITYMTSGADVGKREQAKNMAAYVVIGLVVIWAAPYIVNLLIQ